MRRVARPGSSRRRSGASPAAALLYGRHTNYNPVKYIDGSGNSAILGAILLFAGIGALAVEIPQIQNYADQNGMTFWEALVDEDLKLNQGEMVDAAIKASVIPLAGIEISTVALVGGAYALQQGGLTFNSTSAWNAGMNSQSIAGTWQGYWYGTYQPNSSKESTGLDAVDDLLDQSLPHPGSDRSFNAPQGADPISWARRIAYPNELEELSKVEGGLIGSIPGTTRGNVVFRPEAVSTGKAAVDIHNVSRFPNDLTFKFGMFLGDR